jgi:hypothetical protein
MTLSGIFVLTFITKSGALKERDMLFRAEKGPLEHHGQVIYIKRDWSFDFVPRQGCECSILIVNIELCFDAETRRASEIGGYHPDAKWIHKLLTPPHAFTGSLILLDDTIEDGDIVSLEGSFEWSTFYDPTSGWVCVGNEQTSAEDEAVEFAANTIVVLHQQQIKALWLRPVFVEEAGDIKPPS